MMIDFGKLFENKRWDRSWRYSFLLNVMTNHTPNADHWKESFGVDISQRPLMVDMKVTVNGVEVPFDKWIEHMERSYNEDLEQNARKILQDKLEAIQTALHNLEREADIALGDVIAVHSGRCVNSEWILNQLAGHSFPEPGQAYDFVKKLIKGE